MIENTERFSKDGYIIDQDLFTDCLYRTCTSDYNGCGWIAAYNLRHALGQDVDYDEVRQEMDEMHTERVPGPTLMRVMRPYLEKYVPDYRETVGKDEAAEAASKSRAGIFRYTEGDVPHFITFVRAEKRDLENCPYKPDIQDEAELREAAAAGVDYYRFFNVNDDIIDEIMDMHKFAKEHFLKNSVIALTVE